MFLDLQCRSHQQANSAGFVLCRIIDNGQERTSSPIDHVVHWPTHKQHDDQEDQSSYCSDADACDHDLWTFDRGVGNFCSFLVPYLQDDLVVSNTFNHVCNTVLGIVRM